MPRTDVIKCVFASDYWNDCIDDILFLCNSLEKRYVIFIISWHCSLGGDFLADTLRYLRWPALSRSWHLAASGMGLRVMSHQAGLLTTLHHIHICFPAQGGNMVTTMGWGFLDFRHLFCFTLLMNKACMYHNHIPLMYIFNSPANECWVSYSFNMFPFSRDILCRIIDTDILWLILNVANFLGLYILWLCLCTWSTYITVTPNDHHGVWHYRPIACLFTSVLGLTTRQHQILHLIPS